MTSAYLDPPLQNTRTNNGKCLPSYKTIELITLRKTNPIYSLSIICNLTLLQFCKMLFLQYLNKKGNFEKNKKIEDEKTTTPFDGDPWSAAGINRTIQPLY
jgi:hypothetical protein